MEVSGQFHAPALYSRGKSPWYPLVRSLGGPQSKSGRRGEDKIVHPTGTQLRPLSRPVSSYTDYAIPAPVLGKVSALQQFCGYVIPWVGNHTEENPRMLNGISSTAILVCILCSEQNLVTF
jgi:hypothetical protein